MHLAGRGQHSSNCRHLAFFSGFEVTSSSREVDWRESVNFGLTSPSSSDSFSVSECLNSMSSVCERKWETRLSWGCVELVDAADDKVLGWGSSKPGQIGAG